MGQFIAGQYTATYNAKALGQTADGFRLSHSFFKRLVTGDAGAETPQDAIYRGREQFITARMIEAFAAGIPDLVEPYADTPGDPLTLGVIGRLDVYNGGGVSPTALAKSLVLTPVTGTSAAGDGPASITLSLAMLAEGYPVEVLLAPDLREVPIRCRVYPNMETGVFGTEA